MMTMTHALVIFIISVLLAEILSGRHKNIYSLKDLYITGGSFIITRLITGPLVAFGIAQLLTFALPNQADILRNAPLLISLLGLILFAEGIFYWLHRWSHDRARHPLLYGMHYTHHSAKYINITVMARINVFWPVVQPYGWVSGIAIYLGMIETATVFFTLLLAWNALTHSDFRWDDAIAKKLPAGEKMITVIEWLFITPRLHHTHHGFGRNGKAYRNFCTMLSIYDRLFGTLYIPQGRPEHYGIMGREKTCLEQLLYPLPTSKAKPLTSS